MRFLPYACIVLGFAAGGCVQAWRPPPLLRPNQYQLTREQLVIHSDFPLPPQQPVIDRLLARRNDICRDLELTLPELPIDIYLFPTAAALHTYAQTHYPQFPSRRAFFLETDGQLAVFAEWNPRVEEDLRHETTHGFLHAAVPNIPLWLDEGLAEYYETPSASQGWNSEHLLWLRAALDRGWQPALTRLEQLPLTASMNEADYAEAWLWVHWMLRRCDQSRQILRDYLADLRRHGRASPLSARLLAWCDDPPQALHEYARRAVSSPPQPAP